MSILLDARRHVRRPKGPGFGAGEDRLGAAPKDASPAEEAEPGEEHAQVLVKRCGEDRQKAGRGETEE